MITIIDKLVELQKLQLSPEPLTPREQAMESAIRAQVPKPILAHFDRLNDHGKTGVARVRNGCCCGCHLKICSGTLAALGHAEDINICDNCGRYLYLAPEEMEQAQLAGAEH